MSTELAQTAKVPDQKIPNWLSDLDDVFSEKPTISFPLIDHMIIPLILNHCSFQKSLRYTPLIQKNRKHVRLLSMNTLRLEELSHPSPHKLHLSSLLLRKMALSALVRTIIT